MPTTLVRPRTDESPSHPLQHVGGLLLRYGLVSILLWVGLLKFTAYEARAIQPLVENSPLLSWLYEIFSVRTFSALLGTFEIALALMIAAKPFSWLISAVGSFGAVALFLVTLTLCLPRPMHSNRVTASRSCRRCPGSSWPRTSVSWPSPSGPPARLSRPGRAEQRPMPLRILLSAGLSASWASPGTASAQAAPSTAPPEPRSYDQKDRHD